MLGLVKSLGIRIINSFGWQTLRDIQKNKIIKSMYIWLFIVPVTAKLFAEIEDRVCVTIFGHNFTVDLVLPFSWQALFLAALLFVVANIIFIMFSPEIVKEYRNYQNFLDAGKGEKQLDEYIDELTKEKQDHLKKLKVLAGIKRIDTSDELQNRFWDIYILACYEKMPIRFFCTLFYVSGFMLFADVVYKNIMWVVNPMDFYEFKDQLFFSGLIDFILKIF